MRTAEPPGSNRPAAPEQRSRSVLENQLSDTALPADELEDTREGDDWAVFDAESLSNQEIHESPHVEQ
ncbi:hypothetical protein [Haladaptatus caseinilyticus]|uniref:hypothetical protein n=1 Tax=Haladaptatus caseinilyticus TaxID=2993314 RepID=UPI00224B57F8|nr:hypothetical protein [Haladaptatus caseinilyticus]